MLPRTCSIRAKAKPSTTEGPNAGCGSEICSLDQGKGQLKRGPFSLLPAREERAHVVHEARCFASPLFVLRTFGTGRRAGRVTDNEPPARKVPGASQISTGGRYSRADHLVPRRMDVTVGLAGHVHLIGDLASRQHNLSP